MKVANTKAFGGQVVTYDRYSESREDIGAAIAKEQGATLIPPFEYLPVIAGQGTIGIEIAHRLKDQSITPDQLICCTGEVVCWLASALAFIITFQILISLPPNQMDLMILSDH